MLRITTTVVFCLAVAGSWIGPASAGQATWLDTITGQGRRHDPYPHGADADCDIVVKRPGGNPTQDMTGSIGHAKSYQSNGGPARKRICR